MTDTADRIKTLKAALRTAALPFGVMVNTGGPDILAQIVQTTTSYSPLKECVLVRFGPDSAPWLYPQDCRPAVDGDYHTNPKGLTFADWQRTVWYAAMELGLGHTPTPDELRQMRRNWGRGEDPQVVGADWGRAWRVEWDRQQGIAPRIITRQWSRSRPDDERV